MYVDVYLCYNICMMNARIKTPISTYPYVIPRMQCTGDIGSTPTLIFGSPYTCFLDGLIFSNLMNNDILLSAYVIRTDELPYRFMINKPFAANESMDWLYNKHLTLESGDTIWANSDYADNLFCTMISYRELTETARTSTGETIK